MVVLTQLPDSGGILSPASRMQVLSSVSAVSFSLITFGAPPFNYFYGTDETSGSSDPLSEVQKKESASRVSGKSEDMRPPVPIVFWFS